MVLQITLSTLVLFSFIMVFGIPVAYAFFQNLILL
ncbi:MAG: hypothetical protein JJP05_09750 [cyanobacterium endosymbiont of Rhopalodia gibba]